LWIVTIKLGMTAVGAWYFVVPWPIAVIFYEIIKGV